MVWGKKGIHYALVIEIVEHNGINIFWLIIQLQNRFRKITQNTYRKKKGFLKNYLATQDFPENSFLLQPVGDSCRQL